MFDDPSKPTTALEWKEKGNELFRTGTSDEALTCYQNAIAIDTEFKEGHFNLGLCLLKLKRPEEAYHAFTRAIEIDPSYTKAVNRKLLVLLLLNKQDLAILALDRYFANGGEDAELIKQRTEIGLAYAKEITGQSEIKTADGLIARGKEYAAAKNYTRANEYFNAALAIDSKAYSATQAKIAIAAHTGEIPFKLVMMMTTGTPPDEEKHIVAQAFAARRSAAFKR